MQNNSPSQTTSSLKESNTKDIRFLKKILTYKNIPVISLISAIIAVYIAVIVIFIDKKFFSDRTASAITPAILSGTAILLILIIIAVTAFILYRKNLKSRKTEEIIQKYLPQDQSQNSFKRNVSVRKEKILKIASFLKVNQNKGVMACILILPVIILMISVPFLYKDYASHKVSQQYIAVQADRIKNAFPEDTYEISTYDSKKCTHEITATLTESNNCYINIYLDNNGTLYRTEYWSDYDKDKNADENIADISDNFLQMNAYLVGTGIKGESTHLLDMPQLSEEVQTALKERQSAGEMQNTENSRQNEDGSRQTENVNGKTGTVEIAFSK